MYRFGNTSMFLKSSDMINLPTEVGEAAFKDKSSRFRLNLCTQFILRPFAVTQTCCVLFKRRTNNRIRLRVS